MCENTINTKLCIVTLKRREDSAKPHSAQCLSASELHQPVQVQVCRKDENEQLKDPQLKQSAAIKKCH